MSLLSSNNLSSSKKEVLKHISRHRGVKRVEPEFNSYNYENVNRELPPTAIKLQPQELQSKLNKLVSNPEYDEILINSEHYIHKQQQQYPSHNESTNEPSEPQTNEPLPQQQIQYEQIQHEQSINVIKDKNKADVAFANANTTSGKLIIRGKSVFKSTLTDEQRTFIFGHCNKYLYYNDIMKNIQYMTTQDMNKYGVNCDIFKKYKRTLIRGTNISCREIAFIFIFYVKIKCFKDKRVHLNDDFIIDNGLNGVLVQLMSKIKRDNYTLRDEMTFIDYIHQLLHEAKIIIRVSGLNEEYSVCRCNYYTLKHQLEVERKQMYNLKSNNKDIGNELIEINAVKKVDEYTYILSQIHFSLSENFG
eukprot:89971_1